MKIMIEIEEELPLGQHIATISFPLKVIENMKEKDFENLTFRLLDDKRYKVDLIQVHESTGVVTVSDIHWKVFVHLSGKHSVSC